MCVNEISLELASVTGFYEVYRVFLHGWPVIAKSQQQLIQSFLALMFSTLSGMSFFHHGLRFCQTETSQRVTVEPFSEQYASFHKVPCGQFLDSNCRLAGLW